jgi:uncharacterized protein YbjT (DUF2867 family)
MIQISDSRILVTGASGFIGGTLSRRFAEVVAVGDSIMTVMQVCDVVVNAAGTVFGSAEDQRAVSVDGAGNVTSAAFDPVRGDKSRRERISGCSTTMRGTRRPR